MGLTGMVFGIQHFSIHDGSGVRTNVFLKGCPLSCIWCHNPEGIEPGAMLSFNADRCVHCGACFEICPAVHSVVDGVHMVNRDACGHRFQCVDACAGQALERVGNEMSVQEVMEDVLRDLRYYRASGGGITLSGGEPMMQFAFTEALLNASREAGLDTAMETCGLAPSGEYERIAGLVNTFLFDIKESDPARHREFTGADNALILENLALLRSKGARVILRCPIIPGLNDREEHLRFLADLQREHGCEGVELMPYHKLGVSKAGRMGLAPQTPFDAPDDATVEGWKRTVEARGGRIMTY